MRHPNAWRHIEAPHPILLNNISYIKLCQFVSTHPMIQCEIRQPANPIKVIFTVK
ncbi:protein of unknown function [Magnetospirillum sp. XM-1]|nr:protein of unknown function [Magnetospirillum sp. XM-1]